MSSDDPGGDGGVRPHDPADFRVPAGEEPAQCPHCGRPFTDGRLRDLHVGEVHAEACTAEERERYEAALEAEADDLFVFHLKIVAAIVAVVMGYVYLYGFVLS